jgi:AAA+ ATPase superfamily predicted ATPase
MSRAPGVPKPPHLFDRDAEWASLVAFASDPTDGPTLGVVSGRRRQGKSLLLEALCRTTGGFYFAATEATEAESLRQLGEALADHLGSAFTPSFRGWDEAVDALLGLGRDRPIPVVVDEFPYLVAGSPALPSVVQRALGPGRRERSRVRLILCGSALGFMGGLLSGGSALRGRAGLELVVQTLDYRQAATFWGIGEPDLAILTHAIVGGTPAYRREFVRSDAPAGLDDFDSWVCRAVLNPASPLFREARYLLADEPGIRDTGLYHSVLAAVAGGNNTRGRIANYTGRRTGDLGHPLTVLEDAGLLRREADALRTSRSIFRIAEPLIGFYHAVMRPVWGALERGLADPQRTVQIWSRSRQRFLATVVGPHFEQLCRTWAADFADPARFSLDPGGDAPAGITVGATIVSDPASRTAHQVDVLVLEAHRDGPAHVLSIGEAKWGTRMGLPHLQRLLRIRDLLAARTDVVARNATLACYSGAGFTDDLRQAAPAAGALLVPAADLYG